AIGGDKLPSKPNKDITRKLGNAAWRLKRSTGVPPTSSLWRDRYQAARLYWEIVESDALDHLTTGNDTKGKGVSASLGRLAAYYPLAVRGDSWFWTLAALEAESANGHAFVDAMFSLATAAHNGAWTLVLVPSAQHAAFRLAMGIDGSVAEDERGWSAEAFLDLPGTLKAD